MALTGRMLRLAGESGALWKRIAVALLALILVLVGGGIVAFWTVSPRLLKPYAEAAMIKALGRPFAIAGALELERGWIVTVRAHDARLANADWSENREMATIRTVEASLDLWMLLTRGQVTIPELTLDGPDLFLERNRDGDANWQLGNDQQPSDRAELPHIGRLIVKDARIDYSDQQTGKAVAASLRSLTASGQGEDNRLKMVAEGQLDGRPVAIDGVFGSYEMLARSERPYPVQGSVALGQSKLVIDGSIRDPANLQGVDLAVELDAQDLTRALALIEVPAPEIPPFVLAGRLTRQEGVVRLEQLAGQVGDSSLRGWMAFASNGERPKLSGELTSERFDLDDIGGLIGLPPAAGPDETASPRQQREAQARANDANVIPDTKLSTERWRALDIDLRFRGERINAGRLPLEQLEFRIVMKDGRLRLDPLKAQIAGAPVGGMVAIDSQARPPNLVIDLAAQRMELRRFLGEFGLEAYGRGRVSGRIALDGHGNGLRSLLAGSDGQIALTMEEGALSAFVVEALHLDAAEVLTALFGTNPGTPEQTFGVRCLVADVAVEKGIARTHSFILDTTDSVLTVQGTIDLGREAIELDLNSEPKDNSLLASPSTIYLRGSMAEPETSVDLTGTAVRGAAAVAIGVLLTPLASFLPFVEIGTAEDAPCAKLLGDTQQRNRLPASSPN